MSSYDKTDCHAFAFERTISLFFITVMLNLSSSKPQNVFYLLLCEVCSVVVVFGIDVTTKQNR